MGTVFSLYQGLENALSREATGLKGRFSPLDIQVSVVLWLSKTFSNFHFSSDSFESTSLVLRVYTVYVNYFLSFIKRPIFLLLWYTVLNFLRTLLDLMLISFACTVINKFNNAFHLVYMAMGVFLFIPCLVILLLLINRYTRIQGSILIDVNLSNFTQ